MPFLAIRAAPQAGLVDLHNDRPVIRIKHGIRLPVSVCGEIEAHIRGDEPLRPRDAFRFQSQGAPHSAVRAIRANNPGRTQLPRTCGCLDGDGYAAFILGERDNAMIPSHLRPRHSQEVLQDGRRERGLTEMQIEWIGRVLGPQTREVDLAEQPMLDVPIAIALLEDADRLEILEHAQRIQALHDRRVVNGGTRLIDDVRLRIDHHDADSRARQLERGDQADRARAGNEHAVDALRVRHATDSIRGTRGEIKAGMGFSITWCAVREEAGQAFLQKLGLSATGELEEVPESLISTARLDTGWRIVWYDGYECPFLRADDLHELSRNQDVLLCRIEEHVMASSCEL